MKVLVYPFTDRPGLEKYMGIFSGWSIDNKACMFVDPRDIRHHPLSYLRAEQDNTIIILGHCTEGSGYLRSQESHQRGDVEEGPGQTLSASQLVSLLRDLGMHDNTVSRIKCMNCNSGMYYEGLYGPEASFATRFKMALSAQGFGSIAVLGYMGSLVLMPRPKPKDGVPHRKFAILNTSQGKKAFRGKMLRFSAIGYEGVDKATADLMQKIVRDFDGDTGIKL